MKLSIELYQFLMVIGFPALFYDFRKSVDGQNKVDRQ